VVRVRQAPVKVKRSVENAGALSRLDMALPFFDTEAGDEYEYPAWQSGVYAGGGATAVRRKRPPKKVQDEILKAQGDCCIYCGNPFGTVIMRDSRFTQLVIHWDHYVPYAYQAGNHGFVAACNVCNLLKSSHMFDNLEQARRHLADRWRYKGYTVVCLEDAI
jgi:hypothetical protein